MVHGFLGRGGVGGGMDSLRAFIPALILAVIGMLLQAILANAISIGHATPNFVIAFAIIISALFPTFGSVVLSFGMGLLYNLFNTGPVGAMALVLTLLSYLIVQLFSRMESPNFLFALGIIAITIFLAELFYGLLTAAFVSGISVSEALVQRALPCGVYDVLIGCVLYPLPSLLARIIQARQPKLGDWKP